MLLAYSFIRHEFLYRFCQVFTYFLETSIWETSLVGCSYYLLIMKCCSTLFFVLFRNTHSAKIIWWLFPLYVNCEIINVEEQKQSPGDLLSKKVLLKISKKSQENTCTRVSFLWKKTPAQMFPVKYAKFISQNTSNRIKTKRSKVHKQRVLLKIIYYYTTGWSLNKAFNVSLWIKQRTPSVLLILKMLSLTLSLWGKNCILWLSSFKVILIECVHRISFCFPHGVLCKVI